MKWTNQERTISRITKIGNATVYVYYMLSGNLPNSMKEYGLVAVAILDPNSL